MSVATPTALNPKKKNRNVPSASAPKRNDNDGTLTMVASYLSPIAPAPGRQPIGRPEQIHGRQDPGTLLLLCKISQRAAVLSGGVLNSLALRR